MRFADCAAKPTFLSRYLKFPRDGHFLKKLFAIGDIHGCSDKMDEMMSRINISPERDTLVLIGDYIDRGPDSKGVINSIIGIKKKIKHVICLLGNHEQMLLDYHLHKKNEEQFFMNGGNITAFSYGLVKKGAVTRIDIPQAHIDFFSSLHLFYETEKFIFVHAGLKPGVVLAQQKQRDLLWIREEFINSGENLEKTVVFGHTPFARPLVEKDRIGIDTGAAFGGKLTCVELTEMKFYQI
jgi:serine/threonine protein phosphatase 1